MTPLSLIFYHPTNPDPIFLHVPYPIFTKNHPKTYDPIPKIGNSPSLVTCEIHKFSRLLPLSLKVGINRNGQITHILENSEVHLLSLSRFSQITNPNTKTTHLLRAKEREVYHGPTHASLEVGQFNN
jgi:hypothetical protein